MQKLRVHAFGISLDGFGAGLDQDLDHPIGRKGTELMNWAFATRSFHAMTGQAGGASGVDDEFFERGFDNIGAWIMGRNMFGPVRGEWGASDWKGWWGDTPPFHCTVFVLSRFSRSAITMQGGTTFHFVTSGIIEDALARARAAAGGKDVRLGGGVDTARQYLRARLVDEMHLACAPVLLGQGEALLGGLDLPALGYAISSWVAGAGALHATVRKT